MAGLLKVCKSVNLWGLGMIELEGGGRRRRIFSLTRAFVIRYAVLSLPLLCCEDSWKFFITQLAEIHNSCDSGTLQLWFYGGWGKFLERNSDVNPCLTIQIIINHKRIIIQIAINLSLLCHVLPQLPWYVCIVCIYIYSCIIPRKWEKTIT